MIDAHRESLAQGNNILSPNLYMTSFLVDTKDIDTKDSVSKLKPENILSFHAPSKSQDFDVKIKPYLHDQTRSSSKTLSSMERADEEENVAADSRGGGVVAGSSIPAAVCLGEWPEESAQLGRDLLTQERHSESVRVSSLSELDRIEIMWTNSRVEVYKRQSPLESPTPSSTAWLSHIRSANNKHEQNVELCRDGAGLQVYTLRAIDKGQALLVWYGEELAREVGVPFLTPAHIRGYNEYACTTCNSVFDHPNALKAHILIECRECKISPNYSSEDHPLVSFDSLLHKLNKSSKTILRKKQERPRKNRSKNENHARSERENSRICSLRTGSERDCTSHHQRKEERFSDTSCKPGVKLCSSAGQEENKFSEEKSAFRKPSTSTDPTSSLGRDIWPTPSSTASLTLSMSSYSSPPQGDDSITMSPDSSTDQSSALNLSLRVVSAESPGSSAPLVEPLNPDLRRLHAQSDIQPSYPSVAHWSRAIAANNILAHTFASMPIHAFGTGNIAAANNCLPNVLALGQSSLLAEQYYHRYRFHQQCPPTSSLSILKNNSIPVINTAPASAHPYHRQQQYQHSLSFQKMEELQRHQHRHCQRFQHNHRQQLQQRQPSQQQPQQQKHHCNDISPLSSSSSLGKNSGVSPPLPPPLSRLPQSEHHHNHHQSPRTSSSSIYGLTLPSDKEPLDLLPQAYFANKSKKGHLCLYCGKVYSRKYGLKIHMRTHNGYKPLKCKICSRPFGDPSNLNKHVRLHAQGETPYRCDFCGKVLVRRRDLDRHIKSRHPMGGVARPEVNCDDIGNDNDVEEDWEEEEEEKVDEESEDIIDVASVDGGSTLSEQVILDYSSFEVQ